MGSNAQIIIDGYNFILRTRSINRADEYALFNAREDLVITLAAYAGSKRIKITVVFDGTNQLALQGNLHPAGVRVLYSKPPQNADRLIIEMIEHSSHPGSITVVSSDNFVKSSSSALGCNTLTVGEFQNKLNQKHEQDFSKKYSNNMSKKELDEWLKIFGESE